MSESGRELADYREALREIVRVCAKPFGKDARQARRIARDTLAKWGCLEETETEGKGDR